MAIQKYLNRIMAASEISLDDENRLEVARKLLSMNTSMVSRRTR
jgi:hypothetical protein